MSELEKEFLKSENQSIKWKKYFSVYEELFSQYKNKKIIFVEIGIANGGSLKIWKNFFGKDSKIIGIDLNEKCKKFEDLDNDIHIEIGNQSSEEFWNNFRIILRNARKLGLYKRVDYNKTPVSYCGTMITDDPENFS